MFSFESMKNCKNDKLVKIHKKYENSVNIRPRVQAISPKVYIGVLLSIHKKIKHVLKVCNVGFSFESMKNCKMTVFSEFIKKIKLSKCSTSCPGYISESIHWSAIIIPKNDKASIEGVQRRNFWLNR